jgi:hypothetical protein
MMNEENIDKIRKMVNQLIKTEKEVVDLTEKVIKKAENPTIKYWLRGIQHDSRKHADFGILKLHGCISVSLKGTRCESVDKETLLSNGARQF